MPVQETETQPDKLWLFTILITFLTLRLTVLLFFRLDGMFNAYTDFNFYFNTASMSEDGYYPFINMWYEYPPLLAYLVQGVYAAVRLWLPPGNLDSLTFRVFSLALGAVLLAVDSGILILTYKITRLVWGTERANWVGWVYTCLSLPLLMMLYAHQGVASLFSMLAIYALLTRKPYLSAAALGLGIAAKITPAFLLGPASRQLWHRRKLTFAYVALALLTAALTYLPFILMGAGEWIVASFRALFSVASYATPWALIDGNWGTGYYGPLTTRLDLSLAVQPPGNPSVIPAWFSALVFGGVYAALFFREFKPSRKNILRFALLTAILFHMWSKGWSIQWAVGLIPLFLVCFPDTRGLGYILGMTLLSHHQWPFGQALQSRYLIFVGMFGRTLLLAVAGWRLYQAIWHRRERGGRSKGVLPNTG